MPMFKFRISILTLTFFASIFLPLMPNWIYSNFWSNAEEFMDGLSPDVERGDAGEGAIDRKFREDSRAKVGQKR